MGIPIICGVGMLKRLPQVVCEMLSDGSCFCAPQYLPLHTESASVACYGAAASDTLKLIFIVITPEQHNPLQLEGKINEQPVHPTLG